MQNYILALSVGNFEPYTSRKITVNLSPELPRLSGATLSLLKL